MRNEDTHPLLEQLDQNAEHYAEKIFALLGDHGAQLDSIQNFIEATGDAFWTAHKAHQKQISGQDLDRKEKIQAKRFTQLEALLQALLR